MNKFNLPQGLLDSVTNVLKTAPRDNAPLQEKLIQGNQAAVKQHSSFDNAVASVVAEGRKKEAERQAKFAEAAARTHRGMGKSIVESIATKQEVVKTECIISEEAFSEIATRMKNVGTTRRMQNMTEQKETIMQMTRTFEASFDQIIEASVSAELRSEEAIQEALQSVKADIRTQMLNAVNVANAARVVDESAKIMSFISVQEALKGKQHKIDANKNGKIDANDFEVLKARKARHQGEAVDEAVEQVDEADKPRSAGSAFDKDVAKSFSKKKPGELTGHESKKTSTGTVYTKKLDKEKEETNEGVMATVKKYAAKAGKALVGKNDDELLADLHKDVHGTKPTTVDPARLKNAAMDVGSLKKRLAKEEVEQVDEISKELQHRYFKAAYDQKYDKTVPKATRQKRSKGMDKVINRTLKRNTLSTPGATDDFKNQEARRGIGHVRDSVELDGTMVAEVSGALAGKVAAKRADQASANPTAQNLAKAASSLAAAKKRPGGAAAFLKAGDEVHGVTLSDDEAQRIALIAKDMGL